MLSVSFFVALLPLTFSFLRTFAFIIGTSRIVKMCHKKGFRFHHYPFESESLYWISVAMAASIAQRSKVQLSPFKFISLQNDMIFL